MLNSPRTEMPLSLASFVLPGPFHAAHPRGRPWRPDALSQAEALGDVLLLACQMSCTHVHCHGLGLGLCMVRSIFSVSSALLTLPSKAFTSAWISFWRDSSAL